MMFEAMNFPIPHFPMENMERISRGYFSIGYEIDITSTSLISDTTGREKNYILSLP